MSNHFCSDQLIEIFQEVFLMTGTYVLKLVEEFCGLGAFRISDVKVDGGSKMHGMRQNFSTTFPCRLKLKLFNSTINN